MNTEHVWVKLALRELVDTYGLAVDQRAPERFGRLFIAAGSLEIFEPGVEQPVITYTGTAELESVIELVTRYAGTFHVMANHIVVVEADGRATGTAYCHAHHLSEDEDQDTLMLICYKDDYMLDNGVWRFARRRVMRQWNDKLAADRSSLSL